VPPYSKEPLNSSHEQIQHLKRELASSLIMQTSSVMMQLFDLAYSSYEGMFSFGMGMQ